MASSTSFHIQPDKAFAFDCKKQSLLYMCGTNTILKNCQRAEKWWWGACGVSPRLGSLHPLAGKKLLPVRAAWNKWLDMCFAPRSVGQKKRKSNDPGRNLRLDKCYRAKLIYSLLKCKISESAHSNFLIYQPSSANTCSSGSLRARARAERGKWVSARRW